MSPSPDTIASPATSPVTPLAPASAPDPAGARHQSSAPLLLCLPSLPSDVLHTALDTVARIFAGRPVLIASPDYSSDDDPSGDGSLRIVPYVTPRADLDWMLAARDFVTASQLAQQRGAAAVILLGADAASLSGEALGHCADLLASGADLALPRYNVPPTEGLVTSALLYPMTRALFAVGARFPLALDAGLSPRMAQRLAALGQRQVSLGQNDALLWPAAEAASAGFTIAEFSAGLRTLPQPAGSDFNTLFTTVAGSLFADVESRAIFWQRARPVLGHSEPIPSYTPDTEAVDIEDLVNGYRLAFRNLQEVWALVVPPQSLLALKKLSLIPAAEFTFPASLWARTAYDFALAFHARSLNRGHLLGSFTPLYLAWVASTLRAANRGAATHIIEETAAAFEREKPYLVSRWRWPDRFNP